MSVSNNGPTNPTRSKMRRWDGMEKDGDDGDVSGDRTVRRNGFVELWTWGTRQLAYPFQKVHFLTIPSLLRQDGRLLDEPSVPS